MPRIEDNRICRICLTDGSRKQINEGGYHLACLKKLFGTPKIQTTLEISGSEINQEVGRESAEKMSISGKQIKISVKIERGKLVPTNVGGTYILKPEPQEYPEAPANEHLSMEIGRLLGIETALCGLVSLKDGQLAYITRRFDRNGETKHHQEDCAQIMERNRDEQEKYKYEGSYEEVARALDKACGGKQIVLIRLIERIIHRFLIGDEDYHLKNISLRGLGRDGKLHELTPNYDAVSTVLYLANNTTYFALEEGLFSGTYLGRKARELGFPSRADFLELCERLEVRQAPIVRFLDKLSRRETEITNFVQRSLLGERRMNQYLEVIRDRFKAIFSS